MVTPGNHDVYRPHIKKNGRIAKLHRRIRTGGRAEVCVDRLDLALSGKDGKLISGPLKSYNGFAKGFACQISPSSPFWERTFNLGDGAKVVIRGITSTWLSGPTDSERTPRLLYGSAQYRFTKSDAVHYVVAGHHPPQSMIDCENAKRAFDFYSRLQLFGHKHDQWITKLNSGLRVVAGALHPDRREKPWIPRYNILEISGELDQTTRMLSVKVHPRRWNEEFYQFMADYTPDAREIREYKFTTK
jgi:hypothetical protein